ncbi:hypothetical protein [Asanoa siamensis]|nr:hypothetical protein [Asanoa siamensis]
MHLPEENRQNACAGDGDKGIDGTGISATSGSSKIDYLFVRGTVQASAVGHRPCPTARRAARVGASRLVDRARL